MEVMFDMQWICIHLYLFFEKLSLKLFPKIKLNLVFTACAFKISFEAYWEMKSIFLTEDWRKNTVNGSSRGRPCCAEYAHKGSFGCCVMPAGRVCRSLHKGANSRTPPWTTLRKTKKPNGLKKLCKSFAAVLVNGLEKGTTMTVTTSTKLHI